jgi:hypothetical protein
MDDRFERRAPWIPWALTSVALVLVAIVAYSVGAHREAAMAAGTPPAHIWHRHGFPGFWLLFLFVFVFGGLRRLWWGACGCYGPRYRRCHGGWRDDAREDWEAWHRRAHERHDGPRGAGASPAADPPVR